MQSRIVGPALLAAGFMLMILDYSFRFWAWKAIVNRTHRQS